MRDLSYRTLLGDSIHSICVWNNVAGKLSWSTGAWSVLSINDSVLLEVQDRLRLPVRSPGVDLFKMHFGPYRKVVTSRNNIPWIWTYD